LLNAFLLQFCENSGILFGLPSAVSVQSQLTAQFAHIPSHVVQTDNDKQTDVKKTVNHHCRPVACDVTLAKLDVQL
jgi:hypothetical protein